MNTTITFPYSDLAAESEKPYLDPTPKTPVISRRPSAQDTTLEYNEKDGGISGVSLPDASNERRSVPSNDCTKLINNTKVFFH